MMVTLLLLLDDSSFPVYFLCQLVILSVTFWGRLLFSEFTQMEKKRWLEKLRDLPLVLKARRRQTEIQTHVLSQGIQALYTRPKLPCKIQGRNFLVLLFFPSRFTWMRTECQAIIEQDNYWALKEDGDRTYNSTSGGVSCFSLNIQVHSVRVWSRMKPVTWTLRAQEMKQPSFFFFF